jgi:2-polyprenyl-3-methyl-5-hydroxy-6-metoxy-1,4-benzoquinol methylase
MIIPSYPTPRGTCSVMLALNIHEGRSWHLGTRHAREHRENFWAPTPSCSYKCAMQSDCSRFAKRHLKNILARERLWALTELVYTYLRSPKRGHTYSPSGKVLEFPPRSLMVRSSGSVDRRWFWRSGQNAAQCALSALPSSTSALRVLDFGAGSGRVTRHLAEVPQLRVSACDIDRDAVQWMRNNLVVDAFTCDNIPPLSRPAGSFDAIICFSVLTHMKLATQRQWLQEFHRLLRPGGTLILSLHGPAAASGHLGPELQRQFDSENVVTVRDRVEFSNLCCAYHPVSSVPELVSPFFELIAHTAKGARGNPPQDLWTFRSLTVVAVNSS